MSTKAISKEISHALIVNTVQPLRLQVYGGTMQKDADNDLQKWIAFITECANKLEFLGKKRAIQNAFITANAAAAGTPRCQSGPLQIYSRSDTCRFGAQCKFPHTAPPP